MKKLKIAQVINVWQSVPPAGYGGTETVVYHISQELIKRGHRVDLFASGDSKINGNNFYLFDQCLFKKSVPWSKYLYALAHFTFAYNKIKKDGGYDIIHGHYSLASDLISLSLAKLIDVPSVFTLHSPIYDLPKYEDRTRIFNLSNQTRFVSISDRQRSLSLNYIKTIYHGLEVKGFPFTESPKNNDLLWLGRIVPEKGLELALNTGKKTNRPVCVVGRVDKESENNLHYFQTEIKPLLSQNTIRLYNEVDHQTRNDLMSKAKIFLFPIKWEEPFGLVMIESMACGTPVVAFAKGSVPEVVVDGETGFIVNFSDEDIRGNWIVKKTGIEGLCEAVEKIYSMPEDQYRQMRKNCRAHVEKNFTVDKMVDEYEKVYQQILSTC